MTDFGDPIPCRSGIMSPTREGKRLGEEIGPWSSTRRGINVEVPELPSASGQLLDRYLTNSEMRALSEHFEGVEFVLVRGVDNAGEAYYHLLSGRAGELGHVQFSIGNNTRKLVSHTHPVGGDAFASNRDMLCLDNATNHVSRIIQLDGGNGKLITFSPINPSISIRPISR